MRNGVYRIDLDMHAEGNQVQLTARRGDTARRIEARIVDHGIPYRQVLPANCRAVMTVKTPEGLTLTNDCDIRADGIVIYDFTVFTVKEIGVDACELTLYDGEGGVLTSPRFTILVDDTVFDKGQTIGAAWEEAIERAKEDLLAVTDMLENKTQSMPRTYPTAEEMAAQVLKEGQMTATRGRWFENDGGARTYVIVNEAGATLADGALNPLAIRLTSDALTDALYALPVITDHVTAFDIGLRLGNVRGTDDVPDGMSVTDYGFLDGSVPAENSRLLQYYIDHIPVPGTDPGVLPSASAGDSRKADVWVKRAAFTHVKFPAGNWLFRDPVVVNKPMKFFGETRTSMMQHNRSASTAPYPVSNLFFKARELTVVSGNGASLHPYTTDPGYRVTQALQPGDEEIDLTVSPNVRESVFVETALFFVGTNGVVFEDLLISAANAFSWGTRVSTGYRPGDTTNDADLMGSAYNPYYCARLLRGVNGVICDSPALTADGKLKVESSTGAIKRSASKEHGISQSNANWTAFEHCVFDGFSSVALTMGSLTRVNSCQFRDNYIAISSVGHDDFLHRVYCDHGFIGLRTNSHTVYMDDCWIDLMQGFAVCAGFKVEKKYAVTESGKSYWIYDRVSTAGTLNGRYDCDISYCALGAYAANAINNHVPITGRIGACGMLYDAENTRIEKQDDFVSLLIFNMAKDAVDGEDGRDAKYWNDATQTWSADSGSQTLAEYKASDTGIKYMAKYEAFRDAHIQLMATSKEFLDNAYSDEADMDSVYAAFAQSSGADEEEINRRAYAWMLAHMSDLPEPLTDADGLPESINELSDANRAACVAAATAQLMDEQSQNNVIAWQNRMENFRKLIGAAAFSIRVAEHLDILAPVQPRVTTGGSYNGTKQVHVLPCFGLNCVNVYYSSMTAAATGTRNTQLATEARKSSVRMEPLISQGYNMMNVNCAIRPFVSKAASLYTLKDGAATTNAERYERLRLTVNNDPSGNAELFVSGRISVTENGAEVNSNTPMYSYEDGEATDRNLNRPFTFQLYESFYTAGIRQKVFGLPLIGATNCEIVAVLTINAGKGTLRLHPLKTYTGEIVPAKI